MHQINDAIVRGGKLVLSDLPFADGQHVRIIVAEAGEQTVKSTSIHEIRRALNGCVQRFDEPLEPMISPEAWEMLK